MNLSEEMLKVWRLSSAPLRRLPDFLIAGAPKCGTSSLYDLIMLHPDTRRGLRKEPTNFVHYPTSSLRARANQPFRLGTFLCGEGSVEYFFHPEAPANAARVVPRAKVLFLLRDPVARAWSEYRMFVRSGHEGRPFEEVVRSAMRWLSDDGARPLCEAASRSAFNPVRYVRCGMYSELIARWLEVYPREQTLVLFADDLFREPARLAARVYRFLALRDFQPSHFPHARDSGERSLPDPQIARELREFYAPHDERLRAFLGGGLPWDEAQKV